LFRFREIRTFGVGLWTLDVERWTFASFLL
jgi:hypothetical protein